MFVKGQRGHWLLLPEFFRVHLTNFQKVYLALRAREKGGENWVRQTSFFYLPSNRLHKSRIKSRKGPVRVRPGAHRCSSVSAAAASTLSLLELDSKWLWKATEEFVLARGHESCHPQLSDSLFKLGMSPIWTENLFSSFQFQRAHFYILPHLQGWTGNNNIHLWKK